MLRDKSLARPERSEISILEPWNTFQAMENMFRDFLVPSRRSITPRRWINELSGEFAPEVDLKETETDLILTASVPGMEPSEININVTKDGISISGEHVSQEDRPNEKYLVHQRSSGSFNICYSLPADVRKSETKATYRNGILEVTMPKAEIAQAHNVKVEVS